MYCLGSLNSLCFVASWSWPERWVCSVSGKRPLELFCLVELRLLPDIHYTAFGVDTCSVRPAIALWIRTPLVAIRKLGTHIDWESLLPARAPPHPPSAILQMATSVLDASSTLVGCCPSPVALPAVLGTTHFILGSLSAQSALFPHC